MVLGGDRIGQRKEPEETKGRGSILGAVVVEMWLRRGREASEAGQCPAIMGSGCLSETSLPEVFGVFAVAN